MEIDFKVPTDWQVLEIREIGEVVTGRTPSTKREDFYGGQYKLISPNDLDNGKYVTTAHRWLTTAGFRECRALPKDTVLVGCIGNIGKLGMVQDAKAATNQQINAVICNQNNDPHFVYYSFYANRFRLERAADKTTVPILNKTNFETFRIPVPSLQEQRTIAAVLGLVQRTIEHQLRLLRLAVELKKTLVHQLFTHGMRNEPQKQTNAGLMPTSWNPTPLGTVCEILSGSLSYTDFLRREPSEVNDAVECMGVKVSDMNLPGNENYFIHANLRKRLPASVAQRKLVPKDVVVFPKRGAAIATNKKRMTTTWTVLDPNLIGLKATAFLYPQFLFYWSETFDLRKITDPGPTPQLNKKDLSPVLIPLPSSLLEQKELADAIAAVDIKAQLHRRKHAALSSLFRTLLHDLMTAQIRVHDLNLTALQPR